MGMLTKVVAPCIIIIILKMTTNDLVLAFAVIFGMLACCALGCYTYILSRRLATADVMAHCMERFATRLADHEDKV